MASHNLHENICYIHVTRILIGLTATPTWVWPPYITTASVQLVEEVPGNRQTPDCADRLRITQILWDWVMLSFYISFPEWYQVFRCSLLQKHHSNTFNHVHSERYTVFRQLWMMKHTKDTGVGVTIMSRIFIQVQVSYVVRCKQGETSQWS